MTDNELVRYYAMWLDTGEPAPLNWQIELLRRLVKRVDPDPQ